MLPHTPKDVIKCDLERRHLSRIIWVDAQCPHMCPYMRKGVRRRHREDGEGEAEGVAAVSQGMLTASRS